MKTEPTFLPTSWRLKHPSIMESTQDLATYPVIKTAITPYMLSILRRILPVLGHSPFDLGLKSSKMDVK